MTQQLVTYISVLVRVSAINTLYRGPNDSPTHTCIELRSSCSAHGEVIYWIFAPTWSSRRLSYAGLKYDKLVVAAFEPLLSRASFSGSRPSWSAFAGHGVTGRPWCRKRGSQVDPWHLTHRTMKRSGGRMANPRFGEAASDDGSDDDPGHGNFEVASEEVLKARNLHRRAARRRRADAAPAPATRNPFAAVALTKTGSPGSGASAPAPAPVANPFAGRVSKPSFASGAGSAAASSVAAASPAEPSENVASAPSRVELSNGAAGSSSRAQPAGGEATRAYYAQVRSLNESFATWVRQQATANPLALWTDGVNVSTCAQHCRQDQSRVRSCVPSGSQATI